MLNKEIVKISPNIAKFSYNNQKVIVDFLECESLEDGKPNEKNVLKQVELSFDKDDFSSLSEAFLSSSAVLEKSLEGNENNAKN